MDSETYWAERAEAREKEWFKKSQQTIEKELAQYYEESLDAIQTDVAALYGRFAKDNKLTAAEARKLLQGPEYRKWRMTMEQYIRKIKKTGDAGLERELNTLAMRSRISRLDKLYSDTVVELDKLGRKADSSMTSFLSDSYKDNYYHNLYDIGRTQGLKSPRVVVDSKQISRVLREPWSGKNYSERIWKNQEKLASVLKQEMTAMVHRGESVDKVAKRIAQKMDVAESAAVRLVRTESNYVGNSAAIDSIKDAGMNWFRFMAAVEKNTCATCGGMDGEIFPVSEAEPGQNMPPIHPYCRCSIAGSIYGPKDNHKESGKRIAKNAKGQNYYIPASMKYSEWHEKYVVKAQVLPKNPHAGKAVLVDIKPGEGNTGGNTIKVYEGENIPHGLSTKREQKEPIFFDLSDPKYEVIEKPNDVERVKKYVKDVMKVNVFEADALKNADVIEPFLKEFQELNETHGNNGKLSKISVLDLGFSELAEVSGRHLLLNSVYFNSKALTEDIIKEFVKKGILPKKANLKFVSAHEWGHLMTQDVIDYNPKSRFQIFFNRNLGKSISGNSMVDANEFAADALAAYLTKIHCSYAEKVVKYFQEKGVIRCFDFRSV